LLARRSAMELTDELRTCSSDRLKAAIKSFLFPTYGCMYALEAMR